MNHILAAIVLTCVVVISAQKYDPSCVDAGSTDLYAKVTIVDDFEQCLGNSKATPKLKQELTKLRRSTDKAQLLYKNIQNAQAGAHRNNLLQQLALLSEDIRANIRHITGCVYDTYPHDPVNDCINKNFNRAERKFKNDLDACSSN